MSKKNKCFKLHGKTNVDRSAVIVHWSSGSIHNHNTFSLPEGFLRRALRALRIDRKKSLQKNRMIQKLSKSVFWSIWKKQKFDLNFFGIHFFFEAQYTQPRILWMFLRVKSTSAIIPRLKHRKTQKKRIGNPFLNSQTIWYITDSEISENIVFEGPSNLFCGLFHISILDFDQKFEKFRKFYTKAMLFILNHFLSVEKQQDNFSAPTLANVGAGRVVIFPGLL